MTRFLILVVSIVGCVPAFSQHAKKYVNHTEIGGLFGRVKYVNPFDISQELVDRNINLTVQTFNGIQLTPKLSTGVTVGMDWYRAALINPFAGGIRYTFWQKQKVGLLGAFDAGYGFAWFHQDATGEKTKGGIMLNPGVGIRLGQQGGAAFTIIMSYKRQEATVDKQPLWNQTERTEDRVYNRLALRIGVNF